MYFNKEEFKRELIEKLQNMCGMSIDEASDLDKYMALGCVIRDFICRKWIKTNKEYRRRDSKQIYYFSIEFLLGRLLGANLFNLGIREQCQEALAEMGISLENLEELEREAGLGNGGLGRLAACLLDSLAARRLPVHGCGIRYKYGLFEQKIIDGYQVELPDDWLKDGYVWEIRKADRAVTVRFGGQVRIDRAEEKLTFIHENYEPVLAVPYDIPIAGYCNDTVNTLRLWSAEAVQTEFDYSSFSRGDYLKAVEYKYSVEAISQILYPDDQHPEGMVLRLKQEYFFVSAGIQSIVRHYKRKHESLENFDEKIGVHINDTHPALVIPEMMRILLDEEGMDWDSAWRITGNIVSYTNHTILPEAMEKWPVAMFKTLLPRIYMIVEEINERFCRQLWTEYPGEWQKISDMAVISSGYVHMAHLAVVGSYSVNGVARLHTQILKKQVMPEFHHFYPHKFNNKTNGVTHRRWLLKANPALADLINKTIGASWIYHPADLSNLCCYADDMSFKEEFNRVKRQNKERLTRFIQQKYDVSVDPASLFDIQIKRIHAYKRQVLNVFHIMDLYNRLKSNPQLDITPRTFIFAGKAAPGYLQAKRIIKLINTLAMVINNDKSINDKLKVVFLDNYGVSLAEMLIPAADISEQISTASREASGTGNMKLIMNGAVTLGTLDGANIEIKDEVGENNIIIFGLTADEVLRYYAQGGYKSQDVYFEDARVKTVVDQLIDGFFPAGLDEFKDIYDALLYHNDEFFVLKDFASYVEAQNLADRLYKDRGRWLSMAICNTAYSGRFSSDRTVSEYAIGIWKVKPVIIID